MSQQLKLQVLLSAVDKITRPLRGVQGVAQKTAKEIKETTQTIRGLNNQSKQVDGFRKTQSELAGTTRELNAAQQRAQQLSREFKAAEAPTKGMAREMAAAQNQVRGLTDRKSRLTAQAHQQRTALQQSGIDTRNLNKHTQDLSVKTDQATRALERQKQQLQQVNEQQRRLNAARQSYDRAKQFQGQLAGAGARAAAGGTAALYGGARLLAPGVEFDAAMSRVQALTRLEKESAEMMAIRAQARELGATTSFSAIEVAEGQGFLAMAGFDPDAIQAAMPALLNLSRATDLALGATADISSNILSAYKLPANEMTRLADILTATATRSNVDLTMLGETMKYMAPTARDLGISIEDSAAMAGLLGNIGIQGSMAGTAMREIFNRLVNQTGPAAEAIKELGLEIKDADGNMRSMPEILQDVLQATKDMGNVDRGAVLGTIFGARAGSSISELITQQGDGAIEKFVEILKNSAGEAAHASNVMVDNVRGDLDNLMSAFADVRIESFEINDDGIRDLIQSITETTRAVGAWMKENPELTKTISKVLFVTAALAAVGGTVAVTIAGLLGPLIAIKYASTVLGIKSLPLLAKAFTAMLGPVLSFTAALLANPITWVVLAIAVLIAGLYMLYKHWGKVTDFISNIDWVGLLMKGWGFIKAFFTWSPLGVIIQAWQATFSWLINIDWIDLLSSGWEAVKTMFKWSPLGIIVQAWQATFNWLREIDWLGIAAEAWHNPFEFFKSLPERFKQFGADMLGGLINGITEKLAAVKDKIAGVASAVSGWFKEKLGISSPSKVFQDFGNDTMDGLAIGLGENAGPVKEMDRNIDKLKAAAAGAIVMGALVAPAAAHQEGLENLMPQPPAQHQLIRQVVQPAQLQQIPNSEAFVTQRIQGAALPDIEDATRVIRERLESANLPDNSETVRRIQLDEKMSSDARASNVASPAALTQQFTTDIAAGAIVIQANDSQNPQDIAREIMRQLDERERRAAARERARFTDLE